MITKDKKTRRQRINSRYRRRLNINIVVDPYDIKASKKSMFLIEQLASIFSDVNVQTSSASLSLSGLISSIGFSEDTNVTTNVANLVLTEFPVGLSEDTNVITNTSTLTLSELISSVEVSGNVGKALWMESGKALWME